MNPLPCARFFMFLNRLFTLPAFRLGRIGGEAGKSMHFAAPPALAW
jgi:hypothetical protein